MPRLFTELQGEHEQLDQDFLAHQIALLEGELTTSLALFDRYAEQLHLHIRIEEECLLPAFEALELDCERGGAPLYRTEHERILRLLEELREALVQLPARDPVRTIAHLEREAHYKRVMEHHDLRERTYLYPLLDEHASERERERLWRAIDELRSVEPR